MDPSKKQEIIEKLRWLEKDKDVKIIYACEAGSRAWGFASDNSDWDVRFLYVKPLSWYVSINEKQRDVIEYVNKGNDLDIVGWDIRKALRLLKKSNPALLEWLNSPIQYIKDDSLQDLQDAASIYYSPKSLLWHYLHMARGNVREYLRGKDQVWLKKYLYVVRPLMACNWIEQHNGIPPVNFETLLFEGWNDRFSYDKDFGNLWEDINDLVLRKKQGDELSYGPIIPSIQFFIETEIERLNSKEAQEQWPQHPTPKSARVLDVLFRNMLRLYAARK